MLDPTHEHGTLLFVDDEVNILKSLQRLFLAQGFQVMTAESAESALSILAEHPIDVLVSDMRMPNMDGAEFLKIAAERWPETRRLLLTGYADVNAAASAINEGKIDCYIAKPWKNEELLKEINAALSVKKLHDKNKELQSLIEKQNEELKLFNSDLEKKVKERTNDLNKAYKNLKAAYHSATEVLLSIAELNESEFKGHRRKIAKQAKALAEKIGLAETEVQNIYLAAMLHNLGKIGLPIDIKNKSIAEMNVEQFKKFSQYPILSATVLIPFKPLKDAANIVLLHKEKFDGTGFPNKLRGSLIPIGARILSVVVDYHELQLGLIQPEKCTPEKSFHYLSKENCQKYDNEILNRFSEILKEEIHANIIHEKKINVQDAVPGMQLTRDLLSNTGFLLVMKDTLLTEDIIEKIKSLSGLELFVKTN